MGHCVTPIARGNAGQEVRDPPALSISVIIPMLNEEAVIGGSVRSAREADEVIVVDGGSTDRGRAVAEASGAKVLRSTKGRGRQLSAGADLAAGEVLLFLHADTVLPAGFSCAIADALAARGAVWGRFDLRFDEAGPVLRMIARLISWRSRLSRVATGDQAIFVRRQAFEAVGGIREPELFEDIDLCRRLKRYGPMAIPAVPVVTSARRWRVDGLWSTTFLMWTLKMLYLAGVPASRLKRFYADTR